MNFKQFKQYTDQITIGFDWGDKANELFLEDIFNYFFGHETTLDPNKGILVRGKVGVGKTAYLRLIQKALPQDKKFLYNPSNDIVSQFNDEGNIDIYKTKERLFDDFGSEDIGIHYGNKIEVLEKIILSRYDLFIHQGVKTHFSTNLLNKEIKEKYGLRVYDRLVEMINVVAWPKKEESKRGKQSFRFKNFEELNAPIELTEAEKQKIIKDGTIRLFNEYKIKLDLPVGVAVVYDNLNARGLLEFTYVDIRHSYRVSIQNLKKVAKDGDKYDLRDIINKIASGGDLLRNEVKRVLLKEYFKQLILEGKDLRDLI